MSVTAYLFDAEIEALDSGSSDNWGINVDYQGENLSLGVAYINNFAEGEAFEEALFGDEDDGEESQIDEDERPFNGTLDELVAGVSLHGELQLGDVTAVAKYVTALDEFDAGELDDVEPSVSYFGLGYELELFDYESNFGVSYQATEEARGLELPENRLAAHIGVEFTDYLRVALEYSRDELYPEDGEQAEDVDNIGLELQFEF